MSETIKNKISSGYFNFERPEMLQFIPEHAQKILEVGCGEGLFCARLKRNDREIWGIEINPEIAKRAKNNCDKILIGDINIIHTEMPQNYFDCIIFNDVLEHLYSPWDTLELIKSLLNNNGVVVSSIPNFRYISNLLIEILWKKDFRYTPEGGIMDDTHIRFFTKKSIERMYIEQGYEIIKHQGIKPCKSLKEKMTIAFSFGLLDDSKYKQWATVARVKKI